MSKWDRNVLVPEDPEEYAKKFPSYKSLEERVAVLESAQASKHVLEIKTTGGISDVSSALAALELDGNPVTKEDLAGLKLEDFIVYHEDYGDFSPAYVYSSITDGKLTFETVFGESNSAFGVAGRISIYEDETADSGSIQILEV